MSKTVDEKVVEMKFNNQNFEKNVSQSLNTIDKLKSKLDFKGTESKAADSISKIGSVANNIKLDGMTKAIETINYRFSTMGIVATNIINQITNMVTGKLVGAFNTLFGQIKSGGLSRAMNLEKANFQMTNLLKNEEEVAAVMKNVSDAVDGTAYGLDAAAVVASQLTASGAKAGDELYNQLRSIAGVAAMTSSSYQEIGDIYTTIAGQGKLMAMQLTQLASRGLNVAAIMSKQMNITEAEFRDKVSKGQITFQQFANAMVEEFGEAAGKANDTFDGALSNVKSALSRIGAKVYTPGLNEARDILNELRLAINGISKALDPVINIINGRLYTASKKIQAIIKDITSDVTNMSENSSIVRFINAATKSIEDLLSDLFGDSSIFDHVWNILSSIGNAFVSLFEWFEKARISFNKVDGEIRPIVDIFMVLSDILKDIVEWFHKVENEGNRISRTFSGIISIFKIFGSIVISIMSGLRDVLQVSGILGETLLEITASIGDRLKTLYEKLRDTKFFNSITNTVSIVGRYLLFVLNTAITMISSITEWFRRMENEGNKISRIFSGIISIFKILGKIVLSITSSLTNIFKELGILSGSASSLGEIVLEIIASIGDKISALYKKLEDIKLFEKLTKIITSIGQFALSILNSVLALFSKIFSGGYNIFSSFINGVSSIFNIFFEAGSKGLINIIDKITYVINRFTEEISKEDSIFSKIGARFSAFFNNITEGSKRLFSSLSTIIEEIKNLLKSAFESDFITSLTSGILKLGPAIGFLSGVVLKIGSTIKKLYEEFKMMTTTGSILAKFADSYTKLMDNIPQIGENFNNVLVQLEGVLKQYQNDLKADVLKDIASAIALLSASLYVVSTIPVEDLIKSGVAIAFVAGLLMGAMKLLTMMSKTKSDPINWKENGFINGIKEMVFQYKDLGQYATKITVMGTLMIKLAASVFIIAKAMKEIANVVKDDPNAASAALVILASSIAVMVASVLILDKFTKNIAKLKSVGGIMIALSFSILLIAVSFRLIAGAVNGLNANEIEASVVILIGTIAAIVVSIIALDKFISNDSSIKMLAIVPVMLTLAVVILSISAALAIITTVVSAAGWEQTLKAATLMVGMLIGLVGIIAVLGAIAVAFSPVALLVVAGVLLSVAAVLVALSFAISVFSVALGVILVEIGALTALLSSENCGAAWAALGYLAVLLVTLAVGLTAMTFGIIGVGVLVLLSDALKTLIPLLIALAALPSEDIWSGIGKIAQALLGFMLVGLMATLLSPVLLVMAGVLTALGIALTLCSASLYIFVSAFTALTTLTQISAEVITAGMSKISDGIHNLIMKLLDHVDEFIGKVHDILVNNAPKIKEIVKTVIKLASDAVREDLPTLIDTVVEAVHTIADKLHLEGVINFITAIRDAVNKVFQFLADIINGEVNNEGGKTAEQYGDGLYGKVSYIANKAIDIFVAFCNAMSDAIINRGDEINAAVTKLGVALRIAIDNYVKPRVEAAAENVITGFITKISDPIMSHFNAYNAGKALGEITINGINKGTDSHSPSKKAIKAGKNVINGLLIALNDNQKVLDVSEDIGSMVVDKMKTALDVLQDYASRDYSIEPTIAPVLDMNGMTATADEINQLLSGNTSFGIAASVNAKLNQIQNTDPYYDITRAINTLHNDLQELDANNYTINGVTYDDGSNVANAVGELISAVKVGRRA